MPAAPISLPSTIDVTRDLATEGNPIVRQQRLSAGADAARIGGRRTLDSQVLSDAIESLLKANEIEVYNPFLREMPE